MNLPVIQQQGELKQAVNARELHSYLEGGRDFSTWIKERIFKYDFIENVDFIRVTKSGEGVKFQQACKTLGIKQAELAKWLRDNKWDRWINKSRASTHYSQERGYCMTKYEEKDGVKASGEPYNYTSIEFFILPKGMAKLAKVFGEKAA